MRWSHRITWAGSRSMAARASSALAGGFWILVTAAAVWGLARRLWPARRDAAAVGVVLLLGNVTVTSIWKLYADATRDITITSATDGNPGRLDDPTAVLYDQSTGGLLVVGSRIAGVDVVDAGGATAEVYDPATGVVSKRVALASAETVDAGDLQAALAANPIAGAFFATLTGANRYAILYRIGAVKQAETRARKIGEFVAMLARGETVHGPTKRGRRSTP